MAVPPAPFVPRMLREPGSRAPLLQLYVVEAYGEFVSVPPLPVQPETPERSGKATEATSDWASVAVAASVNEPEAPGLK